MAISHDADHQRPQTNGVGSTNGVHGHSTQEPKTPNAWSVPGPAEFDFRSDVVTTPTANMLAAIAETTLLDDVFLEDPTTTSLESRLAELTGHEAGLLVLSGTMGNQLSIRTHLNQPPHSLLADNRSHIMGWEAGGIASLSSAFAIPVCPENGHHLTLSDVRAHTITSKDIHACPTRLICLENTLAGTILPLSVCQEIRQWAQEQDPPIALHLDGARLWEAVVAGAGSLKDYASCFDSISLCFSKGLGAPIGSLIVGNKKWIGKARHIRKAIGGGMRQTGVITAAARVGVEETFLGGKLKESHMRAKLIASMWEAKGGKLQQPCETNMVWLDLESAGYDKMKFVEAAVKEGVRIMGGRLVVHYQISEEAIQRLGKIMDRILCGEKGLNDSRGTKVARVIEEQAERVVAPILE
ncbi:uncharacterized protein KY384_004108 [Bacidia gigantensis]|uniref:uncharacterized protein n=1 Tax=Bacidia gigantensis TaxID=2732470 RepID=UPI001D0556C3|nr:uncharacterized protein KY384_004108 [Bacidia gigantensis]KAG8530751.1 hypothetical protein KY384_004108 [Bacidia gigantensis]